MITKEKAVIFGTGVFYELQKKSVYSDFNVIAIVDNNKDKQGKILDKLVISNPEILRDLEYDVICVLANYNNCAEIRIQLEEMGISKNKMRFMEPNGTLPYRIPYQFFCDTLSLEEKKELFRKNVERVIIEINSMCNRQCWFCPNSLVDRHSMNIEMKDSIFDSILSNLKLIDYKMDICLSYFNEPLASEKLISRIKIIKDTLPDSFVYLFTNGDYIETSTLNKLSNVGLDLIKIDIYTNDSPGNYSKKEVESRCLKLIKKIGLEVNGNYSSPIELFGKVNKMEVEIISQDFSKSASNRAESLPENLPIPKINEHNRPCIKNYISFHIAYNGEVYPCPNMHPNIEKHKQYCVGNVEENNIFDLYVCKKLMAFREKNLFHRNELPCRSCIWNFESFINNRFYRKFRDRPGV